MDEASSIVHISSYAPTYTNVGVAPPTVIANGFELYVWPCAFGANAGDLTMTATPVIHRTEPLGANMDFRLDVPAAAARLPGVFAILMRPIRTTGSTIVPAGNPHMGLLLTSTAGADWVLPEDGVPVPAITPKPALPPKPF